VLRILPCLNDQCGRIQIPPPHSGSKIEDENLNPHIAKAEVGHMYVVHRFREKRRREDRVFQSRSDYYTLIRIEELKPNESCTITWKRVATPRSVDSANLNPDSHRSGVAYLSMGFDPDGASTGRQTTRQAEDHLHKIGVGHARTASAATSMF
jgi:hypothetical protein